MARAEGKKIYDDYMKTTFISDIIDRKEEALKRSKMKRVKAHVRSIDVPSMMTRLQMQL